MGEGEGEAAGRGGLGKACSRCGRWLPLGWYCRNGSGRVRSECRECRRASKVESGARRRVREAAGRARVTQGQIDALGERQGWRCGCGCGRVIRWEYHVDHRVPLSRGGRHEIGNLRLLAPICNLRLGNSMRY